MSKFEVGDRVQMPGIPLVVEVLEIDPCPHGDNCELGDLFRFTDPSGQDDWAHTSDFEKTPA